MHRKRQKKIIELRQNGRKEKKKEKKNEANCFILIFYKELPLEEELVDFDDDELRPPRLRDTNDSDKSLDEGCFSHSEFKHCSSVGLSDERIDKHCSINCTHSKRIGSCWSFIRTFSFNCFLSCWQQAVTVMHSVISFSSYLMKYDLENVVDIL